MPPLAEVQRRLRDAIADENPSSDVPLLVGGAEPRRRLAIHRRHFETSLVGALLDKFPATTWLIGSRAMLEAVRAFAHLHPPSTPCIAEYGGAFPHWLAGRREGQEFPYVRWFAELEWHLGQVSIATDQPAVGLEGFAEHHDRLVDVVLVTQPGARYFASAWPIDELMRRYLADDVPDQYALSPEDIWVEIYGSRGSFRFDRLEHGEFLFREAITNGVPLGAAAEHALEAVGDFDIGAALQRFVMDGCVTRIDSRTRQGAAD